jgi:hypothetical protein
MDDATETRLGAATGLAALAAGVVGGALERGWPSAHDPAAVAAFIERHRTAILAQSMAFLFSSALFLGFLGSLRAFLARAEGGAATRSTVMFGAGLVWVAISMVAQALQIGAGMARGGDIPAAVLWEQAAVFGVANLPLAMALSACALVALQLRALPRWWGWLSALAAASQLALWAGTVIDHGPLATNGWLTYVLYPAFALWLVPTVILMVRGQRAPSSGNSERSTPPSSLADAPDPQRA